MHVVLVHGMGSVRQFGWWVPWLRYLRAALGGNVRLLPYTWDASVRPRRWWERVRAWLEDVGHIIGDSTPEELAKIADTRGPALIVAHSLGSIIAYKALKYFAKGNHRLVTLGSPLVYAERQLVPLSLPPIARPSTIERWVNVWSWIDLISCPIFRDGNLKAAHRNVAVFSRHNAVHYLRRAATRRAIAWAAS